MTKAKFRMSDIRVTICLLSLWILMLAFQYILAEQMSKHINKLISYKLGFPYSAELTMVEMQLVYNLHSSPGRCLCFTHHFKIRGYLVVIL